MAPSEGGYRLIHGAGQEEGADICLPVITHRPLLPTRVPTKDLLSRPMTRTAFQPGLAGSDCNTWVAEKTGYGKSTPAEAWPSRSSFIRGELKAGGDSICLCLTIALL